MPGWVDDEEFFCNFNTRQKNTEKRRGQISKNKSEKRIQVFRDETRKAKAQNETSKITRNNSVRSINRMRKIKGRIGLLLNGEWKLSADNYNKLEEYWRGGKIIFSKVTWELQSSQINSSRRK